MAEGPKPEDFKPDGPVRPPFMFDMMKGDDAGAGFPMLQLPPPEEAEPRAPKRKAKPSGAIRHRLLGLKLKAPVRRFLLAVLAGQALVVGATCGLPRIVALPPSIDLPALVLAAVAALMTLMAIVVPPVMLMRRGLGGAVKAVLAIVVAAPLVGGTALLMMPMKSWAGVPERAWRAARDFGPWVAERF